MNQEREDIYAILQDIEHEIKPILQYLELIHKDGKIISIGLNCSFKFFNSQTNITRKEIIKLLDWFNDNRKATQEVINNIKED